MAKEKISIFGYQINKLAEKSFAECKKIYDSVKSKNCSYEIYKIRWNSIDENKRKRMLIDSIIKHILEFIEAK